MGQRNWENICAPAYIHQTYTNCLKVHWCVRHFHTVAFRLTSTGISLNYGKWRGTWPVPLTASLNFEQTSLLSLFQSFLFLSSSSLPCLSHWFCPFLQSLSILCFSFGCRLIQSLQPRHPTLLSLSTRLLTSISPSYSFTHISSSPVCHCVSHLISLVCHTSLHFLPNPSSSPTSTSSSLCLPSSSLISVAFSSSHLHCDYIF